MDIFGARRQFIVSSAVVTGGICMSIPVTNAMSILRENSLKNDLTKETNFQRSPINKRSGVTLAEPERIYPLSFISYLSRFLLVFDDRCQRYWYTQAQAIPPKSGQEEVEQIRFRQFGQFAASVEVGLMDFERMDGVERLMDSLVERYGPSFSKEGGSSNSVGAVVETDTVIPSFSSSSRDVAASSSSSSSMTTSTTTTKAMTEREVRKSKEALRQIALLFSLLESEYQPVDSITRILAYDNDACIDRVEIVDGGSWVPRRHNPVGNVPRPANVGYEIWWINCTGRGSDETNWTGTRCRISREWEWLHKRTNCLH